MIAGLSRSRRSNTPNTTENSSLLRDLSTSRAGRLQPMTEARYEVDQEAWHLGGGEKIVCHGNDERERLLEVNMFIHAIASQR